MMHPYHTLQKFHIMKKSFLFIALLTCISIGQLYSQENKNWKQAWEKVKSYEQKGLPQSALKIVDSVYNDALEAEADEQILKSIIYRIKLRNYYQENQIIEAIESLDIDNKEYSPELKAFTHILAAKLYAMYYTQNRYNIDQRTNTGGYKEEDIATWTNADFTKTVDDHFIGALREKEALANVSIKEFPELIEQNDYSFEIQPSLYDFFAHEIVDYYINQPSRYNYYTDEKPYLDKPNVFLPALLFVTTDYTMESAMKSGNEAEKAMAVLKGLLKYRMRDDLSVARVYTDLRRLQIAHDHYAGGNADDNYFKALSALHMQFEDEPVIRDIDIELAKWYESTGNDMQHVPGETIKALKYKKADSICDIIIENHSKCAAVKEAQLLKRRLRGKYLHFQSENTVIANEAFPIYVEYKNITQPTYSAVKIDPGDFNEIQRKHYGTQRIENFLKKGDVIRKRNLEMPGEKDFVKHSTEFVSEPLTPGFYLLMLSVDDLSEEEENYIVCKAVYVSNIAWFTTQKSQTSNINLHVNESISGKPVKNARVKMYKHIYDYRKGTYIKKLLKSTKTNDKGIAEFAPGDDYGNYIYEIETDDEKIFTGEQYYYNYNQGDDRWREKVHFFTDRSVYRPGQTIHVKGICLQSRVKSHKLLKNYSTTVTLLDANYQQVAQKHVTTNEFGSFNIEFMLPEGLLNGRITIKSPHGSTNVMLEEYKRPSFEIKPDPADGNYLLGNEISLGGVAESYTGAVVSDAEYKYRVFREPVFHNYDRWYYSYLPQQREMVSHGTGKTNDKGQYSMDFTPKAPPAYPKEPDISFRFTVETEVTDITGETQSTQQSVVIGYRTLKMQTNMLDNVDLSAIDSINISTMNLNNESIETQGSLILYELKQPDKILNDKPWNVPEFHMLTEEDWKEKLPHYAYADENQINNYPEKHKVTSMPFNTAEKEKYKFPDVGKIKPGVYKIELHAEDAFGIPVVEEQFVRIYDKSARKINVVTPLNLQADAYSYKVGETMEIEVASAFKEAMVYLIVEHEDELLHEDWIKLNQSRKLLEYEITEKLRGGITINAMLVKNGKMHQKTRNITIPYYNKDLHIEYLHFRDETLPGSEEEIQMKISGWNNEAVAAEVLATMYDASLDALYNHNFNFQLYYPLYPSLFVMSEAFQAGSANNILTNISSGQQIIDFETKEPALDLLGLTYHGHYRQTRTLAAANAPGKGEAATTGGVMEDSEEAESMPSEQKSVKAKKDVMDEISADSSGDRDQSQSKNGKDKPVQIRENFNETAFFYPDLRTDENGNVKFSFTSPESLTKWKFLALAHTQDLSAAVSENEMVTRKKLMVVPNMPRFFREGDEVTLNVKVSNLTDNELNGTVELSFLNVLTGKDVTGDMIVSPATVDFAAGGNGNTSVGFDIVLPEGVEAVEYKLIARTENYGDGEQKIIPVLSNRMLVTESMPMYVNGNETKTWHFEKLKKSASSSSLSHHKLALEMTPRPAWYAIQALPYLMEYPYECSEQIFSRYYANSMASWIANSDPQIQRIFEAWKNIPESNALKSNLEKNQDLKANMLEQTPWVLQAKDESERKRRVGLLFDMERMSREQTSALAKLKKKQVSSGGWPWFEGMPESRYITQHIVAGLSHLRHLNVLDNKQLDQVNPMIQNAISYLDREIKSDYDYLKKHFTEKEMKEKHISHIHVHYLYARSFSHSKVQIAPRTADAYKYYYEQAKAYWVEMNYYSKAMIALTMYRTGEQSVAEDIIKSLKEYAIVDDEMGMYWKNPPGYYWYQAPIETQALLIEAFDEITDDATSVERMKQWLLNQKRTQDWKTTKATAEAIYALILTGENLLDLESNVIVEIGGNVYDPKADDAVDQEAGTGYFRKDWSSGEINPEMGDVKLTKTGEGMAWGALHWQYFEDMDKITSHETPLQLEKKLFKRIDTDDGHELQLIDEQHKLEVGDKMVVRIILRSDRDMEYVHMKDMRASSLEPVSTRSGYRYQDGLGYYQSIRDASVDFFFSRLRKGTYVFEYPLYVTHAGEYSNGITNIQCMYAPEYNSHSEGLRLSVE